MKASEKLMPFTSDNRHGANLAGIDDIPTAQAA
jgi:hypothetical protein